MAFMVSRSIRKFNLVEVQRAEAVQPQKLYLLGILRSVHSSSPNILAHPRRQRSSRETERGWFTLRRLHYCGATRLHCLEIFQDAQTSERILLILSVLRLSHLAWFIIEKLMMLIVVSRQPSYGRLTNLSNC
ncbi:unnamed protein product [Urochloa humidicola]